MKKYYEGLLLVDATEPLFVEPSKEDIKNGIPGDEKNCAFALCLKRTKGIAHVCILRTRAYVQSAEDPTTIKYYRIGRYTRRFTRKFDGGDKIVPNGKYVFDVPSASQTLDYDKELFRGSRKPPLIVPTGIKKPLPPSIYGNGSWRNGTGRVRFSVGY